MAGRLDVCPSILVGLKEGCPGHYGVLNGGQLPARYLPDSLPSRASPIEPYRHLGVSFAYMAPKAARLTPARAERTDYSSAALYFSWDSLLSGRVAQGLEFVVLCLQLAIVF